MTHHIIWPMCINTLQMWGRLLTNIYRVLQCSVLKWVLSLRSFGDRLLSTFNLGYKGIFFWTLIIWLKNFLKLRVSYGKFQGKLEFLKIRICLHYPYDIAYSRPYTVKFKRYWIKIEDYKLYTIQSLWYKVCNLRSFVLCVTANWCYKMK